eukprot:scaffold8783_cov24-Tisochrysis_lutea.AAC.2
MFKLLSGLPAAGFSGDRAAFQGQGRKEEVRGSQQPSPGTGRCICQGWYRDGVFAIQAGSELLIGQQAHTFSAWSPTNSTQLRYVVAS